jgi:hypothetical protein
MDGALRPRIGIGIAALALALAQVLVLAAVSTVSSTAHATIGPGCDAGAACADGDNDGFVSCACAAPGVPCDCDDADPRAFPGAPETCDATKDLDCSGDAGFGCGTKKGCLRSVCVPECIPLDDFGCAPYAHCENQRNQRLCAGDCSVYGCSPGFTCDDTKTCVPDCNADVRCPVGQRCRGTNCVDACEGVVCAEGAACANGRCVASCDCAPANTGCAAGEACDRSMPVARCVEQACVGVACPAGSHCAAGKCADDCDGVVCPPKRVCKKVASDAGPVHGACVDLCTPNPCALPLVCDWRTGACLQPSFPEAGLSPVTDTEPQDALTVGGAGLSCTTNGLGRASAIGGVTCALSFLVLMARRVRRRRTRR